MKLLLFTLISTLVFFVGFCEKREKGVELTLEGLEKCKKEAGLEPDFAVKTVEEGANNTKFKCYLKCLYVDAGGFNESGELVIENLKSLSTDLNAEDWAKIVEECKDITDDDQCELAYKVSKCLSDKENGVTR